MPHDDPTIDRLEDQITWYDSRSNRNQRDPMAVTRTRRIIDDAGADAVVAAAEKLALERGHRVVIAVVEGLQQLNQYHANWIAYRSTSEALKHEKFLYLGKAGPYAAAADPHALLAERIESLVSQEHAKWASGQESAEKMKEPRLPRAAGAS